MIKNIILVLVGAIILSFISFYNRFPLLTEDTAAYLDAGFRKMIPDGPTAIYGLFIAYTSCGFSIWLVVFSQALILSLIIYYYFRYFSDGAKYKVHYLAFIFFIAFFTAASITTSTIGAGVFSCICILAISLLLFAEELKQRDLYVISAIAVISIGLNLINLAAVILVILIFSAWLIGMYAFAKQNYIKKSWSRVGLCTLLVFISWLLVAGLHYALGKGLSFAVENQIAALQFQNVSDGPFRFLWNAFWDNLHFKIEDYPRKIKYTETFPAISRWFNWELREGCLSKQYFHGLTFGALSYIQIIACFISFLLLSYLVFSRAIRKYYTLFVFSIVSVLTLLITDGFFYNETYTLSWQIIWPLLLPFFISLTKFRRNIKV